MTFAHPHNMLEQRHRTDLDAGLPGFLARTTWSAERIHAERQEKLRALLACAKGNSAWHARRLAHIDPDTFTEADLVRLPAMAKADVMTNFDEIVTDRRITLEAAEKHLAQLEQNPEQSSYLFDEFHVLATSGSSGRRGVFVYDWAGWIVMAMSVVRCRTIGAREVPAGPDGFRPVMLASDNPSHFSSAIPRTFFPETFLVPVTLPLPDIIGRLNALQPDRIGGYPSMLHQLCFAADAGQLRIAPLALIGSAEPMYPEIRAALEHTFRARVFDAWGCSEAAMLSFSCTAGPGLHLYDDLAIVEPVDEEGVAVGVGVPSAKIFLTNLFNTLMPLIRYEVSDSVTFLGSSPSCACGSHFRKIAPVQGRSYEAFTYAGGVFIHPFALGSVIAHEPAIAEYQVRQTRNGARILARVHSLFDTQAIVDRLAATLSSVGLKNPEVTIELTPNIERGPTGKLVRFVPLRT